MDDSGRKAFAVEVDGLRVVAIPEAEVASLRYFDRAGSFGLALNEALGQPLPLPLRAIRVDAEISLLWRSSTETLLYCAGAENRGGTRTFAELAARLSGFVDGCMVDQTGGICVFRVEGRRADEALSRLGAMTAVPGLGEARSGRLAEVSVLTACVQAAEFLLFVERVYAPHLADWMRATAADLH